MVPFNHFDFIAPYYDRLIKPTDLANYCDLAGLPAKGLLLDLGGGTGQKSLPLLGMVAGIVIADSSMGMLSQARQKPGLQIACSQAERLPFVNESFERVIMVDALHHVSDQKKTLTEIWRVLKPGGRIVIEEPDVRTWPAKVMTIVEKALLMRSHLISPKAIASYFDYPNAQVKVVVAGTTAWIIIVKQAL